MTDRKRSTRSGTLDETIDEVLREIAGGERPVDVRARVLNRLSGEGAPPARSSFGLRWQSRRAAPALGVAAVAIVAVVTVALLVRGPSPSNVGGTTAAPAETSSQTPTASTLADREASVAPGAQPIGGLTRGPSAASRTMRAGRAADNAATEGDAPAIAIEPLSMDPLAAPAPVHLPAIEIDPIVVPDIKIQMIEIKPLDAGSAPRPPDPGKSPQR